MLVRTCRFENNPYVKTRQRIISCETLAHLIEEDLSLQRLTSWNNMCLQVMSQCLNCTTVERAITDENVRENYYFRSVAQLVQLLHNLYQSCTTFTLVVQLVQQLHNLYNCCNC